MRQLDVGLIKFIDMFMDAELRSALSIALPTKNVSLVLVARQLIVHLVNDTAPGASAMQSALHTVVARTSTLWLEFLSLS